MTVENSTPVFPEEKPLKPRNTSTRKQLIYDSLSPSKVERLHTNLLALFSPREARFILFAVEKYGRICEEAYQHFDEHVAFIRRPVIQKDFVDLYIHCNKYKKYHLMNGFKALSTSLASWTLLKEDIMIPYRQYIKTY